MTTLVRQAFSALRTWLGWADPAPGEAPMTPGHGWLLPTASVLLSLRDHDELTKVPVVVPVASPTARG